MIQTQIFNIFDSLFLTNLINYIEHNVFLMYDMILKVYVTFVHFVIKSLYTGNTSMGGTHRCWQKLDIHS